MKNNKVKMGNTPEEIYLWTYNLGILWYVCTRRYVPVKAEISQKYKSSEKWINNKGYILTVEYLLQDTYFQSSNMRISEDPFPCETTVSGKNCLKMYI